MACQHSQSDDCSLCADTRDGDSISAETRLRDEPGAPKLLERIAALERE